MLDKLHNTKTILFADDTVLFFSGPDIKFLERKINTELKQLDNWLTMNRLSLNLKKSSYVVFGTKDTCKCIRLHVNKFELNRENCVKYLGVFLMKN